MSSSSNSAAAAAAKDRGNAAFKAGDFEKAAEEFSAAIALDPSDHIFYSNRSGAYASLKKYDLALTDAEKCVELKKDFAKGYGRKGTALYGLGKFDAAKGAYQEGLKLDANNAQLKDGLEEASKAAIEARNKPKPAAAGFPGGADPFATMFGPEMWTKLTLDPTTKPLLDDPSVVQKLKLLQSNPKLVSTMLGDPAISKCFGVLLGIGANFGVGKPGTTKPGEPAEYDDDDDDVDAMHEESTAPKSSSSSSSSSTSSSSSSSSHDNEAAKKKAAAESESKPLSDEEKSKLASKKEAEAEKSKGNDAYKERKFDTAIAHYSKASELDSNNMVYLNNLSAVYYELKEYDKCIDVAKKAYEIGTEFHASFKDKARAWERVGNAYLAQKKLTEAIEAYGKSLMEEGNDKVRQAQKRCEELKRKQEEEAYHDKDKSEEHKQKGNTLYQAGQYADAIKEYSEALRRDPSNYKVYSNRANCYSKMMDWGRALEDCDKCLKIDPKFVKALIRKAKIYKFLKQFHKALDVIKEAMDIEPNNAEALDVRREVIMGINTSEGDPERAKRAMEDPEIQSILRDPTMNKVLSDMQNDPQTIQAAMRDKDIRAKIEKLIAAGILQTK